MNIHSLALILAGAAATAVISFGATMAHGPRLIAGLEQRAQAAIAQAGGAGVTISFSNNQGWMTRHPQLAGGNHLADGIRTRVAEAVAAVPGMGGVHWRFRGGAQHTQAMAEAAAQAPLHCQHDVEAVLEVRSIRFAEASAAIDPASRELLDEVAAALRPCVGSIIAITGHTDGMGDQAANLALSRQRADAVRNALAGRGIPEDGLRATGVGSAKPLAGLEPTDPANRRIEFSVIATVPLRPTPVDTPGPG